MERGARRHGDLWGDAMLRSKYLLLFLFLPLLGGAPAPDALEPAADLSQDQAPHPAGLSHSLGDVFPDSCAGGTCWTEAGIQSAFTPLAQDDGGGLLPEVEWKVIGYDCGAEAQWAKDTFMQFDSADGSKEIHKSWDEYTLNPEGWEAGSWSDTWNPITRERLTAEDVWWALEYLPVDAGIGAIHLMGNPFEILGRRAWIVPDEAGAGETRYALALTNREQIDQPLGGNVLARSGPGQYCAFYDEKKGVLVAYMWLQKIYDGGAFIDQRARLLHITSPTFSGERLLPDLSLEGICSISSPALQCAWNDAIMTGYEISPSNKPAPGEDVTVTLSLDHPENIESIRYMFGHYGEQEEVAACRNASSCVITYQMWREIVKPEAVDPFSMGPDYAYIDVYVQDVSGNQDNWGTALQPKVWNRPPAVTATYIPDQAAGDEAVTFNVQVQDPDGDPYSIRWSVDEERMPELNNLSTWAWTRCSLAQFDWTDSVEVEVHDEYGASTKVTLIPPKRTAGAQRYLHCPSIYGYELSRWDITGTHDLDIDVTFQISNRSSEPELSLKYSIWTPDKEAWYCRGEKTVECFNMAVNPEGAWCADCGWSRTVQRMKMTEKTVDLDVPASDTFDHTEMVRYGSEFLWDTCIPGLDPRSLTSPPSCWVNGQFIMRMWLYAGDSLVDYREEPIFYTSHLSELVNLCDFEFLSAESQDQAEDVAQISNKNKAGYFECTVSVIAELLQWATLDKVEDAHDVVCGFIPEAFKGNVWGALKELLLMAPDLAEADLLNIVAEAIDCGGKALDGQWENTDINPHETAEGSPEVPDSGMHICFDCDPESSTTEEGIADEDGTIVEVAPAAMDMDLHFYSLDGNHVGVEYESGMYEMQVSGALSTGDVVGGAEQIYIPPGTKGFFKLGTREIETSPEAFDLAFYRMDLTAHDQDGDGRLLPSEIAFGDSTVIRLAREAVRGTTVIFTPPLFSEDGDRALIGEEVMEYIDDTPPQVDELDIDLDSLTERRATMGIIKSRDDHDPSPRMMVVLRSAAHSATFYATGCLEEEGVKLVQVDPSSLPAGEYEVLAVAVDASGNRGERPIGEITLSGGAAPESAWRGRFANPAPLNALYRRDLSTPVGDPVQWPSSAGDPKGVFPAVGHLHIGGYALGVESQEISMAVEVPPSADVLAIPMATALNGRVEETDSEAGVLITVLDGAGSAASRTFATNIMETSLGVDYLYAYADVSPLKGQNAVITLTLLQPDVCSGAACTHEIDLFIGPAQFEQLPDLCTSEPDGAHVLYDYLNDPTPTLVEVCEAPEALYMIEASAHTAEPFDRYGPGADQYSLEFELPGQFLLLDFNLHYGPRMESLRINGSSIPSASVHQMFPVRRGTYNRVPAGARYSFANREAKALEAYFKPGSNRIEAVVAADNDWEERPFSLYLRFAGLLEGPEAAEQEVPREEDAAQAATETHLEAPTAEPETEPILSRCGCLSGLLPFGLLIGAVWAASRTGRRRHWPEW